MTNQVFGGQITKVADRQPPDRSPERDKVVSPSRAIQTDAGVRLREARERRGLTLRDISNLTKIPLKVLDTIERNDIAQLPPVFFTRAFVRAYAAEVGLDSTQVLQEYPVRFESEPATGPLETHASDGYTYGRMSQIPLLVLLSLAIYYGSYKAFPSAAAPSPFDSTHLAAAATMSVREPAVNVPSDFAFVTDGMQLRIQPSGTCRVSATADGRPVISRLVQPGESVLVEGREEIVLRVGDAGACGYSISGLPSRQLEQSGSGVTIRFTGEHRDTHVTSPVGGDSNRPVRVVSTSAVPVSTIGVAPATTMEPPSGIDDGAAIPSINMPAPGVPDPESSADLAASPPSVE